MIAVVINIFINILVYNVSFDVAELIKDEINVYKFEIADNLNQNIMQYFSEVNNIIENEKCVLVHCVVGISRSATLVIAYLMCVQHMTLLEAYTYVKIRRRQIQPNYEFMKQLIKYEFSLYGKNSVLPNVC